MNGKRHAAVLLTVVFALSSFCSCSKSVELSSDGIKVKEDDPWYASRRFRITRPEVSEDSRISETGVEFANDRFYVSYKAADNSDYTKTDTYLKVLDLDGNEELYEISYPDMTDNTIIRTMNIVPNADGKTVTTVLERSDNSGMTWTNCLAQFDLASGEVTEVKPIEELKNSEAAISLTHLVGDVLCIDTQDFTTNVSSIEDYIASLKTKVLFYRNGEYLSTFDPTEIMNKYSSTPDMVTSIEPVAGTDLICLSYLIQGGKLYVNCDPETGEAVSDKFIIADEATAELSKGNGYVDKGSFSCTLQGEYMMPDQIGNIYKYNEETSSPELYISCNDYSPFYSDFESDDYDTEIDIVSCTDQKVVMLVKDNGRICMNPEGSNLTVTVLEKADKNPNAGKTVIEIESPGSCSDYLSLAITEFNSSDPDYLIRVWNGNSMLSDNAALVLADPDLFRNTVINQRAYVLKGIDEEIARTELVTEQLKESDVPDIILNVQNTRAMNDDYLTDLSDFIDKDVQKTLYTNILDATKIEGKSYFLPVTISIEGIVCQSAEVEEGSVGLTFDQFAELLKTANNGEHPFTDITDAEFAKREFFVSCIDIMSCIKDNKVDFDNADFKEGADFVKNRFSVVIPDALDDIAGWHVIDPNNMKTPDVRCMTISKFMDFAAGSKIMSKPYSILGLPSADGRGPSFSVDESISVPSSAKDKAGAKRFIDFLYKGDFVSNGDSFDCITVSRDIMAYELPLIIDVSADAYSSALGSGYGLNMVTYLGINYANDTMREQFLKAMESLSSYRYEDPDVLKILYEETDAYFHGDKSIDEVIKICNDRASTVLNERR